MLVPEGLVGLHRIVLLQLLQHYWWGIDLDIEWFALETNRDHSVVFEIAVVCFINVLRKCLENLSESDQLSLLNQDKLCNTLSVY